MPDEPPLPRTQVDGHDVEAHAVDARRPRPAPRPEHRRSAADSFPFARADGGQRARPRRRPPGPHLDHDHRITVERDDVELEAADAHIATEDVHAERAQMRHRRLFGLPSPHGADGQRATTIVHEEHVVLVAASVAGKVLIQATVTVHEMGLWDRLRGKPTRDDFAAAFVARLREAGDDRAVRYDPEAFELVCSSDRAHQIVRLASVYRDYLASPGPQRARCFARFVRAALAGRRTGGDEATAEEVLTRLLPRLQTRLHYESLSLLADTPSGGRPPFAWRPIAEHMALGLVLDFPDHVEEVPTARFEELGIGLDEAFERARVNLERASEEELVVAAPGLFVSAFDDCHDASRLILTEKLRRLPLRGEPVVMVPNRDHLLVAGSDDTAALAAMASVSRELMQAPRFLSSIPLCLVDDDYAPFVPAAGHPLHGIFAELRVSQLVDEYAQQKRLLERKHEREGVDVFVASFSGFAAAGDESAFSYCVWTKDVAALLPRAERIALLDPAGMGAPVMAAWEVVAEAAGELMEPLDVYPPRYRVNAFPDPGTLADVRARGGS